MIPPSRLMWMSRKKCRLGPRSTLAALCLLSLSALSRLLRTSRSLIQQSQHEENADCGDDGTLWGCLSDVLPSRRSMVRPRAVLFSPYDIVPGGGERYLLCAGSVFQEMKYHVIIVSNKRNVCKTKQNLLRVADQLDVSLSPVHLEYRLSGNPRLELEILRQATIDVFFLLGNEKLPQMKGYGKLNIYMCQFPFDLDREMTEPEFEAWTDYDLVLVNSKYTYKHYNRYTEVAFLEASKRRKLMPLVSLLYPPIARRNMEYSTAIPRTNIVMLGRIFSGRQNKGYIEALSIFDSLRSCLNDRTSLHIVGSLMPGHQAFFNRLVHRSKNINLPIEFHTTADKTELAKIFSAGLVFWHLTGIDAGPEDPASEEHFGISAAEAMAAGLIPVVLDRGGLKEIVAHGETGSKGKNAAEIRDFTCWLFQQPGEDLHLMQKNAIVAGNAFSFENFQSNLTTLVRRGFLSKPFRHLIRRTGPAVLDVAFNLPRQASSVALIIEDRQHYALEYVVKNVLCHLGPKWSLLVVHTNTNERYVHTVLSGVRNASFRKLAVNFFDVKQLNAYMKSVDFWGGLLGRVLIFQTDSLLLHGNISSFLQYDYIGAPWHQENEQWSKLKNELPDGVGNGGLSLRDVGVMREIARNFGGQSLDSQNEDLFYVLHMQNHSRYRVPSRGVAYQFAWEVPCIDIEWKLDPVKSNTSYQLPTKPLGLHAAWYYMTRDTLFKELLYYLESSVCIAHYTN